MPNEVNNENLAADQNKKSPLNLIVIIVAVVILVQLVAVAFIIISVRSRGDMPRATPATEAAQRKSRQAPAQLSFSEPIAILVNVKGTSGDRYFKSTLVIEYNAAMYPLFGGFINTNLPRFTDIAINVLSARDINVLDNPAARNNIRSDLITEFSKIVPADIGKINNILITEWLIQ